MSARVLVTGATGFVGGRLADRLRDAGWDVRCLVRDRAAPRARALARNGFELHEGDVLAPETLRGAGDGVDAAYYLIRSMGRGGPVSHRLATRAAGSPHRICLWPHERLPPAALALRDAAGPPPD